jgi:hypothetical protein
MVFSALRTSWAIALSYRVAPIEGAPVFLPGIFPEARPPTFGADRSQLLPLYFVADFTIPYDSERIKSRSQE